jgi:hypothetical protein
VPQPLLLHGACHVQAGTARESLAAVVVVLLLLDKGVVGCEVADLYCHTLLGRSQVACTALALASEGSNTQVVACQGSVALQGQLALALASSA